MVGDGPATVTGCGGENTGEDCTLHTTAYRVRKQVRRLWCDGGVTKELRRWRRKDVVRWGRQWRRRRAALLLRVLRVRAKAKRGGRQ